MEPNRRGSGERYNPITGTGIPATAARANTSAIFGNSPGSIEYMFIPPSATTRPSIPTSSSEKRRSLSRESLRRSFPPVSEGQPESDECSSVSDKSECGSEAEHSERTREKTNALPKTPKPLSRSTSSRLPRSVSRPCVMKRAHSFTRDATSRPTRGPTNDANATNSATDLTNQIRRPGASATSKIPRKLTSARNTGSQSSRIPLKRADVNSNTTAKGFDKTGNECTVVKRTVTDPQASGIPERQTSATAVKKRVTGDAVVPSGTGASVSKTGISSGIPVKSSARVPAQHPGGSTFPRPKQNNTQVNVNNKLKEENGRRKEAVNKENDVAIAVQAGKQLLKTEGTGDELQVTKSNEAKSRLPGKSGIPKANIPKAAQPKSKSNENVGGKLKTVKNKQSMKNNDKCLSDIESNKASHCGVSKRSVNKRMEAKSSGRSSSSMSQRTESSHSDTDSVSSKEDTSVEIGNEFCLSRENSRSKIPIMSKKGRNSTKTTGGTLTGNEGPKTVQITKRGGERQKQGTESVDNQDSKQFKGDSVVSSLKLGHEQVENAGESSLTNEGRKRTVVVRQHPNSEPDVACGNEEKELENDKYPSTEGKIGQGNNLTTKRDVVNERERESPSEERESAMTEEQSVLETIDVLQECGNLETMIDKTENLKVESVLMSRNNSDTSNTNFGDQTINSSNVRYCSPVYAVDSKTSTNEREISLSARDHLKAVNGEDSSEGKTGNETRSGLMRPSGESSKVSSSLTESVENVTAFMKGEFDQVSGLDEKLVQPQVLKQEQPARCLDDSFQTKKEGSQKQTDENIDAAGIFLEGKVGQMSHFEERLANVELKKEGSIECKTIVNEKENLKKLLPEGTCLEGETGQFPDSDERLVNPGVENEEPVKSVDNCFECRAERNEKEMEEILEMDEAVGDNGSYSNVRRYPTFISPRKSLVLCKHHEKLKNGTHQTADTVKPLDRTSLPTIENAEVRDIIPKVSPDEQSRNLPRHEKQRQRHEDEHKNVKNIKDKCDVSVYERGVEILVDECPQKVTPAMNVTAKRDANPSAARDEPTVKNCDQRSASNNNVPGNKEVKKAAVQRGGHSPLLALSRDKKFVSGENLTPYKDANAMESAFSLEWDDAGTELSPPNFSDDEDPLGTGSDKRDQDRDDDRRPSIKLMDTNEALDKLKVIQSLIMKEAESRRVSVESRKDSVGSAGKYVVSAKGPGEEQRVSKSSGKHGIYTTPTPKRKQLSGHRMSQEEDTISDQDSPTSEIPRKEVSSPTIWDRIDDKISSQDQTTELLNETLAKLKASPQLSGSLFARRTISSRSLPGSRQPSKERLLSDSERPVYVYTSSWMNASGKNSMASSLSLSSANRSLPSSRQNLTRDPSNGLKRSESASGRMEKENGKLTESKGKKEFRLSNFDEMLSDDGHQELQNEKNHKPYLSPVFFKSMSRDAEPKKPTKTSKRKKKAKNTAETMNNVALSGISMEDLADGNTTCQCGGKNCVIS